MPCLGNKRRQYQLANTRKVKATKKTAESEAVECESTSAQTDKALREENLMPKQRENATASENEEQSKILAHVFQLLRLIGDLLFPECEESGLWVTVPKGKHEFRLET